MKSSPCSSHTSGRESPTKPSTEFSIRSAYLTQPPLVDRAIVQFREYDDQSITDHVIAVQANDLDHIFTYDAGFRTLGFTVLPHK